jgi:hypothetical protein
MRILRRCNKRPHAVVILNLDACPCLPERISNTSPLGERREVNEVACVRVDDSLPWRPCELSANLRKARSVSPSPSWRHRIPSVRTTEFNGAVRPLQGYAFGAYPWGHENTVANSDGIHSVLPAPILFGRVLSLTRGLWCDGMHRHNISIVLLDFNFTVPGDNDVRVFGQQGSPGTMEMVVRC